MYHNVCSMFYGADEVRSSESIVYNQRNLMTVCNICYSFYIDNIRMGIAQTFDEQCFRVFLNCIFKIG